MARLNWSDELKEKDVKYAGRYYAGSVYQWPWRGAVE